jgi:hypothetical protein
MMRTPLDCSVPDPKALWDGAHLIKLLSIGMSASNNVPVGDEEWSVLSDDQKAGCDTARVFTTGECLQAKRRSREWVNRKHLSSQLLA